jgi:hypothetical protein
MTVEEWRSCYEPLDLLEAVRAAAPDTPFW